MTHLKSLTGLWLASLLVPLLTTYSHAQKIEPPWLKPPSNGVNFTVAGIDNVPDLHGDIVDPQLVVFFAGNQFMVVHELIESFQAAFPQYKRVFVETLPPGILAKQIEEGSLVIGNLKIALTPDVYTAGERRIREMSAKGWFDETAPYARNRLAIMVYKGNPKRIQSLQDLGRDNVRVSMPNPAWEGIGGRIIEAYLKVGGRQLEERIMVEKLKAGTTFLTQIHHRQTPMRIMSDQSDAGPVWYTEAYFQQMIENPIDLVEIPKGDNIVATYVAGKLKSAPHKEAASDFFRFLLGREAQSIYGKYQFLPLE